MNRHIVVTAVLLIIVAVVFSEQSWGQTSRFRRKVDKSIILFQFQNHLFKTLNAKLEEFQEAFEEDYQAEDHVFDAFRVFKKADPVYGSTIDAWVKEFPTSYTPYVARAMYYCACALKARGSKWVIDKEQDEYKEMERYYSQALLDIAEALKLDAKLDVCYAMQVEIGMATENEELKTNALTEASKYHPYAYRVRWEYLQTLTPRRGGSYEQMKGYIISCTKLAVYNPKIKELSASIPADEGKTYYSLGKYDQAVMKYTEALKYSNYHSYYADRGDAYTQLQDYKRALADYDHALELSPNDPEYVRRKAQAISNRDALLRSQANYRQIEEPDPYADWPPKQYSQKEKGQAYEHAQKGNEYMGAGQFEKAIPEFTAAIRLLPNEYVFYHNRAMCYLQLKNDGTALQDFLRAIERKRDDIEAYVRITFIYADRGSYDEALNSISTAIRIKPENAEAIYYRAKVYERKGMNIEALEDARQACEMGYQRACREYKMVK